MDYHLIVNTESGDVEIDTRDSDSDLYQFIQKLITNYNPESNDYTCSASSRRSAIHISFDKLKQVIKDSQKITGVELTDYLFNLELYDVLYCKRCDDQCYTICQTCGNLPKLEKGIEDCIKYIEQYRHLGDDYCDIVKCHCESLLSHLLQYEALSALEPKTARELIDTSIAKIHDLFPDIDVDSSMIFSERMRIAVFNLEMEKGWNSLSFQELIPIVTDFFTALYPDEQIDKSLILSILSTHSKDYDECIDCEEICHTFCLECDNEEMTEKRNEFMSYCRACDFTVHDYCEISVKYKEYTGEKMLHREGEPHAGLFWNSISGVTGIDFDFKKVYEKHFPEY